MLPFIIALVRRHNAKVGIFVTLLLVDIGNTRIKWGYLERGHIARGGAAVHSTWRLSTYKRRLFDRRVRPTHLWVTSVAGGKVDRALAGAARRAGLKATFVSVPRRGGGVRVGYQEPWRLGVDRFVAAVGAHALFPTVPVCVVGIGTALTVDLVDPTPPGPCKASRNATTSKRCSHPGSSPTSNLTENEEHGEPFL